MGLVGVVSTLLALGLFSADVRRELTRESDRESMLAAQGVADEVASHLSADLGALDTVAGVLATDPTARPDVLLRQLRSRFGGLQIGYVSDPDGRALIAEPPLAPDGKPIAGTSYADREYFQRAKATHRNAISQVEHGRRMGGLTIHLGAPIVAPNGEFRGLVEGSLELETIQAIVDRYVAHLRDARVIVLDASGRALTHDSGESSDDLRQFRDVSTFFSAAGKSEVRTGVDEHGVAIRGAAVPLDGDLGWMVVVSHPQTYIDGLVQEGQGRVTRAAFAIAAIAMALVSILVFSVARPVGRLARAAVETGNGHFPPLPKLPFWVSQEISDLNDAMKTMMRRVESHRTHLENRVNERTRELRAALDELKTLMEQMPTAIGIVRAGRLVFVNRAWTESVGYEKDEILGTPLDDWVASGTWDDAPSDATSLREISLRRKEGSAVVWGLLPSRSIRYEGDDATLVIGRDVTERNRMRAQLVVTDRMAALGTLAAGVAHEINNPLTFVLTNLETMEEELAVREDPASGDFSTLIREAREGVLRVRDIVRDMKSFSRVDLESVGPIDVGVVVARVMKMLPAELRYRARFVHQFTPIPQVMAEDGKLGQVLLNLVVNAAHAIPEGADGVVTISTQCTADNRVEIRVEDTGVGIPGADLVRIFDPFFTTKPVGTGTGLGLFVCHTIVRGFGGEIAVESEVGRGTTVTVVLPAATPDSHMATNPPPSSSGPRGGAHRILVVDDEPIVGRALRRALQRSYEITVAVSAREALEILQRGEHFDLVVCDLVMPEMTGMDLYREVARVMPDLEARFIFMTGQLRGEHVKNFLETLGATALEKPFDLALLRKMIKDRLQGASASPTPGSKA